MAPPVPGGRGGPVDLRLVRLAPSFRWWLVLAVAEGAAVTAATVAQAWGLAAAVARLAGPAPGSGETGLVAVVAGATLARAGSQWALRRTGAAAAASTKAELRARAFDRLLAGGGRLPVGAHSAEVALALGEGLDRLDGYLGRYVPRAVLAVLSPVLLLVVVARLDLLSAAVLVVVLALLPVLLALVGLSTRAQVTARWEALSRLSRHFLDAVEGLPTLRAFQRARAQRTALAESSERLARLTLATLRTSLLSAFVLETGAAVGTALVAVPLGLRLVDGRLGLATALTVLLLAPEVFQPLRAASAEYHASVEGTAALDALDGILGEGRADAPPLAASVVPSAARGAPPASAGSTEPGARRVDVPAAPGRGEALVVARDVAVTLPGRGEPALCDVDLVVTVGERVVVVGPSGSGKSTLLAVVVGLCWPSAGTVLAAGERLTPATAAAWRERVAWVPQHPAFLAGSVADNLRLGAPDAGDADLWDALDRAGLADEVARLPGRLAFEVGERAGVLSAGQRSRLAVARAVLRRGADLVVLDEPTSHLDEDGEAALVARLGEAVAGRTVLVATHRPAVAALATRRLSLVAGHLAGMAGCVTSSTAAGDRLSAVPSAGREALGSLQP